MSEHARVVVIGGGIMGVNVLYHLAAEGWTDVMLCEKAELTSGATWHAAGQLSHNMTSLSIGWIANYTIDFYQRIERETGQSVSWHPCGGIRMAYNELELDWCHYVHGIGRALDMPMEFISLDEVRRLNPLHDPSGAIGALRSHGDGHVDPAGACQAVARAARALGATIKRRCRVTGLTRRPGGEWEVATEQGTIIAEHVVNAAGYYGRQVGEWMGIDVPLAPVLHTYLVTDTVPELETLGHEIPIMRDEAYRGYVRQEQKSLLMGFYENANAEYVWTDNGPPWDSENELFDVNYDVIGECVEGAFKRFPRARELGIKRVVRGAITHSPDGGALLGPAPGVRNAWLATGSAVGIGWGGGMGRLLAQWMVHDDTEVNVRGLDPRRFGPYVSDEWIVRKSVEDYEMRHDPPVPGLQRPALRPVRKSPVHDRLAARGAVFGDVHGYERPRWFRREGGAFTAEDFPGSFIQGDDANGWRRQPWFEAVGEECRAVRERVGVFDLSAFTKLEVSGADAAPLIDRLIANRLPRREGGVVLAHALTRAGTIDSEFTVIRLPGDRFYLCSGATAEHKDIDRFAFARRGGERVEVTNLSSDWGCLMLAGPMSREVLDRGTDADVSNSAFPWLTARDIVLFGVECRVLRVSYTGELGYEIHAPADYLRAVYDGLMAGGEVDGIVDFGSHALNSLRLEKGYKGGTELSSEVTLPEAEMMRFADLDKDDFVGKAATLARIQKGPRWRLVQLEVAPGENDCVGTELVLAGDRRAGTTSSGGYGHAVEKSLAFAYVAPAYAEPGTELSVVILGEPRPARVLAEPVYDAANRRLRG